MSAYKHLQTTAVYYERLIHKIRKVAKYTNTELEVCITFCKCVVFVSCMIQTKQFFLQHNANVANSTPLGTPYLIPNNNKATVYFACRQTFFCRVRYDEYAFVCFVSHRKNDSCCFFSTNCE